MSASPEIQLRRLLSTSPSERLEAARFFAEKAEPHHETALRDAIARESVLWIKAALQRALSSIASDWDHQPPRSLADQDDLPSELAAQVHAKALEETTSQLLHEIEPILGSLRLAAESEIAAFEESDTRRALDRLDKFLSALSRLRRAASVAKREEFGLDELVSRCIQETPLPDGLQVQKVGQVPCVVEGDRGLVELALANGIRNAVEATIAVGEDFATRPITAAWGTTDVDNWISVIDLGHGFKGDLRRAFEVGTTTKAGHLGMGLAIAQQAIMSLGGNLLVVPKERGVQFEMRWPKPRG